MNFGDRPHETLDFIGYRGVCPQKSQKKLRALGLSLPLRSFAMSQR